MASDELSDPFEEPIQAPLGKPGKYPGANEYDKRCQKIGAPTGTRDMDKTEHLYRAEYKHMCEIDFKTNSAYKLRHRIGEHHALDRDRIHQPCRKDEHRFYCRNIKAADRGWTEEPSCRQGDDHKQTHDPDCDVFADQPCDILAIEINDATGNEIAQPPCKIAGNCRPIRQKIMAASIVEYK